MSECREKDPDVIFIGDCIFETLQHTETWNLYFAPLHCLNFSIYQDQTQNVLWRLKNGELDNVKPKIVVLLVGTNNIQHTADEVAEGIFEIVKTIRDKLADAYIVLPVTFQTIHFVFVAHRKIHNFQFSRPYYLEANSRTPVVIEIVQSIN